mmetsp:Transcript_6094/g.17406  ORF Transcript_6094/g.17406 Transcript_6094/m.17406 type:complete len:372 (-) Transcript_6094:1492-2607(-)
MDPCVGGWREERHVRTTYRACDRQKTSSICVISSSHHPPLRRGHRPGDLCHLALHCPLLTRHLPLRGGHLGRHLPLCRRHLHLRRGRLQLPRPLVGGHLPLRGGRLQLHCPLVGGHLPLRRRHVPLRGGHRSLNLPLLGGHLPLSRRHLHPPRKFLKKGAEEFGYAGRWRWSWSSGCRGSRSRSRATPVGTVWAWRVDRHDTRIGMDVRTGLLGVWHDDAAVTKGAVNTEMRVVVSPCQLLAADVAEMNPIGLALNRLAGHEVASPHFLAHDAAHRATPESLPLCESVEGAIALRVLLFPPSILLTRTALVGLFQAVRAELTAALGAFHRCGRLVDDVGDAVGRGACDFHFVVARLILLQTKAEEFLLVLL